mmetsp:Transcript_26800/g.50780  ORF Transcript_26800/g.50780 Transcript_26800/m.50780 type:complete len:213 (+) Transcript_26800:1327-1965(+)
MVRLLLVLATDLVKLSALPLRSAFVVLCCARAMLVALLLSPFFSLLSSKTCLLPPNSSALLIMRSEIRCIIPSPRPPTSTPGALLSQPIQQALKNAGATPPALRGLSASSIFSTILLAMSSSPWALLLRPLVERLKRTSSSSASSSSSSSSSAPPSAAPFPLLFCLPLPSKNSIATSSPPPSKANVHSIFLLLFKSTSSEGDVSISSKDRDI